MCVTASPLSPHVGRTAVARWPSSPGRHMFRAQRHRPVTGRGACDNDPEDDLCTCETPCRLSDVPHYCTHVHALYIIKCFKFKHDSLYCFYDVWCCKCYPFVPKLSLKKTLVSVHETTREWHLGTFVQWVMGIERCGARRLWDLGWEWMGMGEILKILHRPGCEIRIYFPGSYNLV